MNREKLLKSFSYVALIFFILTFLTLLIKEVPFLAEFVDSLEVKSLDIRESVLVNTFHQQTTDNSKVALIVIDDDSLENLSSKYGFWPWNRQAYADIIKYLEKDGADSIFLDFMFLGFQNGNEDKDWNFINEIKKHDNIYISMNFDYREKEENIKLPLNLAANLDNKSDIDYRDFAFTNVRGAMPEVFNVAKHISFINFQRDNDGIARRAPTFFIYQDRYYPYAALQISQDYLYNHGIIKTKKFIINKNNNLLMGDYKIQLDKEGYLVLNWHNKSDVEMIPFWKVINNQITKGYFKDKIVAVGASAVSLNDTKSSPLDRYLPGVKIHTTFINNVLNHSEIIPVSFKYNLFLSFIAILLTTYLLFKINANILNVLTVFGMAIFYAVISSFLLWKYNIWIDFAYPVFLILMTYTIVYVIKFIKKSKDFDKTYKLATTDGLTELYNHRYFQEQMISQIDSAKRYGNNVSLIMIDIDFFKKFNDKYGHQVGDDVLRKIAFLLKQTVRLSDITARYGGEEMAIILPNTNLEDALKTANKLCNTINEKPFKLTGGLEVPVTISLGVSTYPMHGETPEDLIKAADNGLYNAKENGRNQVGKTEPFKEAE